MAFARSLSGASAAAATSAEFLSVTVSSTSAVWVRISTISSAMPMMSSMAEVSAGRESAAGDTGSAAVANTVMRLRYFMN